MGLCKCPKKKVTTQFCFEHRVNVCESCLVENHYQCIVNSYVNWLKDSDYNPVCELCHEELSGKECVRLVCYDVFHWQCLNEYANNLPNNTAPAGYVCPTCGKKIFPEPKLVSPVADKLVQFLSKTNWARTGLELPLLEAEPSQVDGGTTETPVHSSNVGQSNTCSTKITTEANHSNAININYSESNPEYFTASSSRRLMNTKLSDILIFQDDDDDTDKYRRRSPLLWLKRWLKNLNHTLLAGGKRPTPRRKFMILLLVALTFITVITLLYSFSRGDGELDPAFDPRFNPNIKIGP